LTPPGGGGGGLWPWTAIWNESSLGLPDVCRRVLHFTAELSFGQCTFNLAQGRAASCLKYISGRVLGLVLKIDSEISPTSSWILHGFKMSEIWPQVSTPAFLTRFDVVICQWVSVQIYKRETSDMLYALIWSEHERFQMLFKCTSANSRMMQVVRQRIPLYCTV